MNPEHVLRSVGNEMDFFHWRDVGHRRHISHVWHLFHSRDLGNCRVMNFFYVDVRVNADLVLRLATAHAPCCQQCVANMRTSATFWPT